MDEMVSLLEGEWRGTGVADFPTIARVEYVETLTVERDAERRMWVYEQSARLADGTISHRERGFIQRTEDGGLQLWNSQDNGRCEILRGAAESSGERRVRVQLWSAGFLNDPLMVRSRRVLDVHGDRLRYELVMETTTAATGGCETHLVAELERIE